MLKSNDSLFLLIKSLTKAEKRNFKVFSNRHGKVEVKNYILLFDYLERSSVYSEKELLSKHPSIKKSQIPNLRSKLYNEILYSLRHLHRNFNVEIQIREALDFAAVLYNKGFYKESLNQLDKAKRNATEIHNDLLIYTAISLERRIESYFVSGTSFIKTEEINSIASKALKSLETTNSFANFSISLYSIYLKNGYVKNVIEYNSLKTFFNTNLPTSTEPELNFYDKVFLYQSYVCYYNMVQDFPMYYKYSQRWIDLFESNPHFIFNDLSLYLNAINNCLNALYMADKQSRFKKLYKEYVLLKNKYNNHFDQNSLSAYEQYKNVHLLNKIFLDGKYDQGVIDINELIIDLEKNPFNWDNSRMLVFNYKIACVYFGAGDHSKTLDYLNKVINQPLQGIRLDIHCFSRILSLITHFELGNDVLVSYQIKSVYRFLSKFEDTQKVHKEIFTFLRKTSSMKESTLRNEFISLKTKLQLYKEDPFEKRPFLYLDIISWLDSKIYSKSIQTIIQEKIRQQ